jgi:hypothetical protein
MEELMALIKEPASWVPEEKEEEEAQAEEEKQEEEPFNPEEQVHTISLEGSIDEVFNKICTAIDPFYPKDLGEEEIYRSNEDVGKIADPNNEDE